MGTPNRNDRCPCGSGKKYKQCCLKHDEALATSKRAETTSVPDALQVALAHHQAGHLSQAESIYQQILQAEPNHHDALHLLGVIAHQTGRDELAVELIGKALTLKPDLADAYCNLGSALQKQANLDAAIESFQKAISLKPGHALAHNNLGNALRDQGKLDKAVECYHMARSLNPDDAETHNNLGVALQDQGKLDAAVECFQKALSLKPNFAEAHFNLGSVLLKQGKHDMAVKHCHQVLLLTPDHADAHSNLGLILQEQGKLDKAVEHYHQALLLQPNFAKVYSNLANALQVSAQLDNAITSYRRALEIKPDYAEAYSNLLFCLSHHETVNVQSLFVEHCGFAEKFEAPLRNNWPQHTNSRDPGRHLQIGFVSGDLRSHAVANFIEPVLTHLSVYPQLSLHAYANHEADDSTTQHLRSFFARWHQIAGLSDEALAQKIRDDGIDILIDLSGHTAKNRLLTFARKPAPVQASWMGYPGTTGLGAMDYYLADRYFLPPGKFDNQFTEKIVRLPASVPFLLNKDIPPVNALPALSNGYVTFGSFNRLSKLSRPVIALWSQLLRALPDSQMLLGGMPESSKYDILVKWFAQEGIAPEQLSFRGRCSMGVYMDLHHQVDICLDTFPYNGGTTTFHALSMGVPTLTLVGGTAAGRAGACILGNVGLEAFAVHDAADFVQKGLFWAGNLAGLSGIRAELRERLANSALGQPAVVAAGVERALRIMWRRWCAGLPPESFEVTQQEIVDARLEADK
jgi:predicted O-linked N-acetylglucosamine transferase (SPINDLY family)